MDICSIRAQQGHQSTKTGRLIRDLCNEVERLQKKDLKWQFLMNQIVQLQKRETRKLKRFGRIA